MAEQEEEKKPEKEEPQVVTMSRGDYMIHVYIQTGKTFVLEGETLIDPYVEIDVLSQKK